MSRVPLLLFAALAFGCGGEVKNSVQTPSKGPPQRPGDQLTLADLQGDAPGLRVLFVGNSHVFTNDVPGLVGKLAKAAGEARPLMARSEAPGGTSFQMHWNNGQVQRHLNEVKWDLVVLQDQSAMPNFSRAQREKDTVPYAKLLSDAIKESGARPVLFMTWGYRDGFVGMQKRSRAAYEDLAEKLQADVVPVGIAWETAHAARPDLLLWSPDGNHADVRGSYLAACAFYAAFYGKSPVGNAFTADLDPDEAKFLQETAANVVELRPGGLAALAPGRAR